MGGGFKVIHFKVYGAVTEKALSLERKGRDEEQDERSRGCSNGGDER